MLGRPDDVVINVIGGKKHVQTFYSTVHDIETKHYNEHYKCGAPETKITSGETEGDRKRDFMHMYATFYLAHAIII